MLSLALAFLAGLGSALGFEPLGLWPATILGFSGLLLLVERATRLRSALALGFWFGAGQFLLGLNWIATAFTFQAAMPAWLGWLAVLLLSLYLAIFPAAAAGLAWRWAGKGAARPLRLVLLMAAAWIVTEWLRATLFTGFAWNPAAVSLVDTPLAPFSTLAGTYALSALVVLAAGALRLAALGPRRAALVPAAILLGSGLAGTLPAGPPAGAGRPIRIVQPNIGQELKWSRPHARQNRERLERLSRRAGGPPALLIWPEAAITEPVEDGRRYIGYRLDVRDARRQAMRALEPGGLLLTGGLAIGSRDGLRASSATNSVFAIDDTGRLLARYDKAHLVPYGEYLPLRPLLSALGLSRLAPGDLDFAPGPGPRTLDIPGAGRVGFQLCYEIIFSGNVVDRAARPDWLFNPSNDAWFGAWGPPQHLAQARLRALEEGVPIVRATPTGISALIDARGRILRTIESGIAGTIDARLPPPAPPTLFARFGHLFALLFAAFLVLAAAIAGRGKAR